MGACMEGHFNVAKLLIAAGASLNIKEIDVHYIHFYLYDLNMCAFIASLIVFVCHATLLISYFPDLDYILGVYCIDVSFLEWL